MAYATCKDGPTRTRFQAVRLYGLGYPVVQIMDITGCSRTSLMEWCTVYRRGGSTALLDKRLGGNRARLTSAQIQDLQGRLHTYTPGKPVRSNGSHQRWAVLEFPRPAAGHGVMARHQPSKP
jgi:transposase